MYNSAQACIQHIMAMYFFFWFQKNKERLSEQGNADENADENAEPDISVINPDFFIQNEKVEFNDNQLPKYEDLFPSPQDNSKS